MTKKSEAIFFRAHIEADLANIDEEILALSQTIKAAQDRITELAPRRRALLASIESLNAEGKK